MKEKNILTERDIRLKLANKIANELENVIEAIAITGSVAYGTNETVTIDSDLDLVIVADDIKLIKGVFFDKEQQNDIDNRYFEGYLIKHTMDDIPVSLHILNRRCLEIISRSFVSDIRVFRQSIKSGEYKLYSFDGRTTYKYTIKNKPLKLINWPKPGFGARMIVPVSFIKKDKYFLGIHRDKLLSAPLILLDKNNTLQKEIDILWRVVIENLYEESMRAIGEINLHQMNILNALSKKKNISIENTMKIAQKTIEHMDAYLVYIGKN